VTALAQPDRATRAAKVTSEILAPGVVSALLPLVAGATTHRWSGVGWGALAIVFTAVIPLAIILTGVKLAGLSTHHINRREQRAIPLSLSVLSVGVGYALLTWWHAPVAVRGTVAVLGAVGALITVVNLVWKLSAHAATIAAAGVVVTALFGPAGLPFWAAVLAACWARLRLGMHDVAQVGAGLVGGFVAADVAWWLIR